MEEVKQERQRQIDRYNEPIIYIKNRPVMESALDVIQILGSKKKVIIRAVGENIPNAVAVANIITEKILHGNSKVQKITLDTESAAGIGHMTSNIEIILEKT